MLSYRCDFDRKFKYQHFYFLIVKIFFIINLVVCVNLRTAPMTTTTTSCCPAEGLVQTSPEGTDQTVPFRRHDSACSMISSCSDVMVKRERCSVSTEAESSAPPSSPFAAHSTVAPATTSQLFNHGARRGRPCADHVSVYMHTMISTSKLYVHKHRYMI